MRMVRGSSRGKYIFLTWRDSNLLFFRRVNGDGRMGSDSDTGDEHREITLKNSYFPGLA